MISEDKLKEIKENYPSETKIKLLKDMEDEQPILAGTIGIVDYIDSEGQLHMKWENGRTLALIPEIDKFEVISKPEKIKVIIVEPKKEPYMKEIYNTLRDKQEIVGGLIQCVSSFFSSKTNYDFIVNEEGKMEDLPKNRIIWDGSEIIRGNMIVAKVDDSICDYVSLSDEEINYLISKIKKDCPMIISIPLSKTHIEHDEVEM